MSSIPSVREPVTNPAHDVLREARHPLDCIFAPKVVAVIGATENPTAVGRTVLWNLISSPFGGTVYPVNPKRPSVLGIKAYPNLKALPEKADLIGDARSFLSAAREVALTKPIILIKAGRTPRPLEPKQPPRCAGRRPGRSLRQIA